MFYRLPPFHNHIPAPAVKSQADRYAVPSTFAWSRYLGHSLGVQSQGYRSVVHPRALVLISRDPVASKARYRVHKAGKHS